MMIFLAGLLLAFSGPVFAVDLNLPFRPLEVYDLAQISPGNLLHESRLMFCYLVRKKWFYRNYGLKDSCILRVDLFEGDLICVRSRQDFDHPDEATCKDYEEVRQATLDYLAYYNKVMEEKEAEGTR